MIEFDRILSPICILVNKCFASLFPGLPAFPEFSFTRLMATLWRVKVFDKMQGELFDAFKRMLGEERRERAASGKEYSSENEEEMLDCCDSSRNANVLSKFLQAVADISINEVTIHMLGSTKLMPDSPYLKLEDEIILSTE